MIKYLVQKFLRFRERGFVQITQKTLVSLFPFLLFSAIVRVISQSFFSDRGYINMLFSVSYWFPGFQLTGQVLSNLSNFTSGLAGPLATYFAGKYTAGHYGRSTGTAGVTAGKYIYQNQAASYTEITVTGEDAQHSDLPTNDEVVALIKQHIESQDHQNQREQKNPN